MNLQEKDILYERARSIALKGAKAVAIDNSRPCRYFFAYKAIYPPKCTCAPCAMAYETMQTFDDEVQAMKQGDSA